MLKGFRGSLLSVYWLGNWVQKQALAQGHIEHMESSLPHTTFLGDPYPQAVPGFKIYLMACVDPKPLRDGEYHRFDWVTWSFLFVLS